jgi:tetratricopeptide (TPR) repeat protein
MTNPITNKYYITDYFNPAQGTKRTRNEPQDNFSEKKRRIVPANAEGLRNLEWSGVEILPDLIFKILSFLPFKKVLVFEQLSRVYKDYTPRRWKELLKEERVDFDWSICQTEVYPDRCRFLLSRATDNYISARRTALNNHAPPIEELYQRFEGIMLRFPCFGSFVWTDLTHHGRTLKTKYEELFKKQLEQEKRPLKAGDLVLEGLLQLEDAIKDQNIDSSGRAFTTLQKAIQGNATYTSLLAIEFCYESDLNRLFLSLTENSIGKNNDFRGLDRLLIFLNAQSLYDNGVFYAPVLAHIGKKKLSTKQFQEAEILLDRAIADYGDHAPAWALAIAGRTKIKLNKYIESELLNARAFAAYEDQVPVDLLINYAFVKYMVDKYAEADLLFDRGILALGDKVPAWVLPHGGFTKYLLNKLAEADPLFDRAIALYGDQVPAWVLALASMTKDQLKNESEAKRLFYLARAAFRKQVPDIEKELGAPGDRNYRGTLANRAIVLYYLNQPTVAESLLSIVTASYEGQVPDRISKQVEAAKYLCSKYLRTRKG